MSEEPAMEILPRRKFKPKSASSKRHDHIVGDKGIENAEGFVEEAPLEIKEQKKMNKEKKKNMGNPGEVYLENNGDISVSDGNGNADAMGNAGEKKKKKKKKKMKKKREKNNLAGDTTRAEIGSGDEVEANESLQAMENHKHDDGEKGRGNGYKDEVGSSSVNCEVDIEKVERKKRKRERKKNKDDDENESEQIFGTDNEGQNNNSSERIENKKKKKKMMTGNKNDDSVLSVQQEENMPESGEEIVQTTISNSSVTKKLERKKKKKKKNESFMDDPSVAQKDIDRYDTEEEDAEKRKKKKKKAKFVAEDGSNDPTPNKSNKKVRFSGEVEVFTLLDDSNTENGKDKDNLVRGKRFTSEEDEIVKEAVLKYIAENDLGEDGLNMVLNCKKHPQLKGCWKEIASAIPYRPYEAIYYRAQVLFRRSEGRKWTQEEYEMILKYQEQHGNKWRELADELGKHRWHVKDTWRRIKLPDLKKGHWSQKEYQKLFDLVNKDLELKVFEEKRSKHGMLRDNICWTAISDRLSTRNQATCCVKWYKQLTSPMVEQGLWADTDDYRLLGGLYSLDATCVEDVDWDSLVEDRSGEVCRKRWSQMVLHIGHHGNKSFAEQVEILARRYCPNLIEAREAWDSKPRVP